MRLTLAAVGRARDGPVRALCDDYAHRLPWSLDVREVNEGDGRRRREREADKLLACLPEGGVVVALDGHGRTMSSEALAAWLGEMRDDGRRDIAFVIGGADGLDGSVLRRADMTLSLGAMTWPHLLVRAMLLEQLYRAATILSGHPYHRA